MVEGREELAFGLAVGLEALVEVEMVASQVCEHGDVEVHLVEAVESEAVAGRLDDGVLAAGLDHGAKESLHLRGFGSRHALGVAVDVRAGYVGVDGPEATDANAGGFEDGGQEVGGRGLAVRAGDADDGELAARVAMEGGGGLRESDAGVVDSDDGLVAGEVAPRSPPAPLNDDGGGARIERLDEEGVAIDGKAGDGDEEGARLDAARVVLDVFDDGLGVATHKLGAGELLDERSKNASVAHRSRPAPSASVFKGTVHIKKIRKDSGSCAPDAVLAPVVGGKHDAATIDLAHVVDKGGGVGEVVQGHFEEGCDLERFELEGVGPLAQPADEGPQAEVASRPDLVEFTQKVDILGGDTDLFLRLAQGGEGGAAVCFVAGAAGEADLTLVVLDLVRTLLEEDVETVVALVEEEQGGCGLRLTTVGAARLVRGERGAQLLPERG